jgi:hypothetical protein
MSNPPQTGPGAFGAPPRPGGGGGGGGSGTLTKIVADAPLTGGTIETSGTLGLAIGSGLTLAAGTLEATAVSSEWTAGAVSSLGAGLSLPPASPTSFNPSDKNSAVTLSNGDQTATAPSSFSNTWCGVRGTTFLSSGKVVFEVTCNAADGSNGFVWGVANASWNLSGVYLGEDGDGIGFQEGVGNVYFNGTTEVSDVSCYYNATPGTDTAMVAIDFTQSPPRFWFLGPSNNQWNGSGTANPATNTGGLSLNITGPLAPAFVLHNGSSADEATLNTTGSFVNVIPSGFAAWDSEFPGTALRPNWQAGTVEAIGTGLTIAAGGTLEATAVSSEWTAGAVSALNGLAINSGTIEPVVGSGLAINSGTIVNTETQEWSGGTVSAVGSGLTIAAGGTIEAVIPPSGNTFQSATVLGGSAIALTTTTPANITSISLENGQWLVYGAVFYENDLNNTQVTRTEAWTSEASATAPTRPNNGAVADNGFPSTTLAAANIYPAGVPSLTVGVQMINVTSGPTTVYLSTAAIFDVSTLSAYGFIGAVPLN